MKQIALEDLVGGVIASFIEVMDDVVNVDERDKDSIAIIQRWGNSMTIDQWREMSDKVLANLERDDDADTNNESGESPIS